MPIGLITGTRYRSTARPPWASSEATQPPLEPPHLPLADVEDLSECGELRLAITLRPGADPETMKASLRGLPVVAVEVLAVFPAPLA